MKTFAIALLAGFVFSLYATFSYGNGENPLNVSGKATVNGKVVDKKTGENLAGATILVKEANLKIYSDLEGNFTITNLEPGTYSIEVNYISYQKTEIKNLSLQPGNTTQLQIEILSE